MKNYFRFVNVNKLYIFYLTKYKHKVTNMENKQKIIIVALIGIIIVLGAAIMGTLLKEPSKTVELFENGTTIEVSADTNLTSHDNFSSTYQTGKNTTIIGIDNNNLAGALASKILSELIVNKGEMQDNGLYKLDKKSIMELGDQLGQGYDENNIKEVFVGIKHNTTVNQTIILIGIDEQEMTNIIKSVNWKLGTTTTTAVSADTSTPTSSESSNSQPTAYAYKSDGTPMYSQSEVDDYMLNKYGMVDYHVGENGYIDMDEAGYDNAGNPI